MVKKKHISKIDSQEISRKFGLDRLASLFLWFYLLLVIIEYSVPNSGLYGLNRVGPLFFLYPIGLAVLSFSSFIPVLSKSRWLNSSSWVNLLINNAVIASLVIFLIPLRSPHYMILAYIMFLTVYWKGGRGFWAVLAIQVPAIFLELAINGDPTGDGSLFYFAAVNSTILMIFGGVVLRLTSIDRNLREEFVLQSRKIDVERERLKSLINSVAVSVIATNNKGSIMLHNGRAQNVVNTAHSIMQKHIDDVVDLLDGNEGKVDLMSQEKSSSGVITRDDLHIVSDEDQDVAIRMTASPINATSIHRSDQGYIFLFADITREKSLDEQRDEFVHLLSHELRTPIAIIEGGISIAREDKKNPLSKQQKTWLKRAHESTMYLSSILNDLASLTKVERDNLKTVPMVTRPYNLLKRLSEDYEEQASKREITIEIADKCSKQRVISSEVHIHEILQNFVSNAIKYTQENTVVTLNAAKSPVGVIFSVRDHGAGISKENQKQLFTKYFRSNDASTKKAKGTGLGLYVSLNLAKRIGAKIWVESKLGDGTTFFLEVPNMVKKDMKTAKAKKKPL